MFYKNLNRINSFCKNLAQGKEKQKYTERQASQLCERQMYKSLFKEKPKLFVLIPFIVTNHFVTKKS